jgi:hypothetical protein
MLRASSAFIDVISLVVSIAVAGRHSHMYVLTCFAKIVTHTDRTYLRCDGAVRLRPGC